jgi:hypothetical protein
MTRLPSKITIAVLALASLFLYVGFNADTSSKTDHSTWEQYGGGPVTATC